MYTIRGVCTCEMQSLSAWGLQQDFWRWQLRVCHTHRLRTDPTDLWEKPKAHSRQLKLPKQKVRSSCELPSPRAEASLLPQMEWLSMLSPEFARGTASSSLSSPCPWDVQSSAAFNQLMLKPKSSGTTLWTSSASLTELEILFLPLKSLRKTDSLAF